MRARWVLASLLLPIVVLAGWVVRLETARNAGREVVLAVQAYDPRDLLAGHYLQYAVDYGSTPCDGVMETSATDVCVCLDDAVPPQTSRANWAGACSMRPNDCATFISGRCEYARFVAGIERFYIPEAYAPKLTQVPAHSTVKVRVVGDGSALVNEFLVEGVPLSEYVAKQP